MTQIIYKTAFIYFALVVLVACGSGVPQASKEKQSADASSLTERMTPPLGYYEIPMAHKLDLVFAPTPVSENPIVFINLAGTSVRKGFKSGETFVACSSIVNVPKARLSARDREDVAYFVNKYISSILPDVKVVMEKPSDTYHSVVHVGGNAKILGCGGSDIKFVAPADQGDLNPADVAFVFSEQTADLDDLIVQIENAIETMYDYKAPPALFLSGEPAGAAEIDSMSQLLMAVDKNKLANIAPLKSELEKLIPGGARYIDDFNKIITATITASEQAKSTDTTTNTNRSTSSAGGGLLSWIGQLLSGQVLPVGGGSSETPAASVEVHLPDYASLIGIKTSASIVDLFNSMEKHKAYVSATYDTETQSALNSMLVVAYSQAFRALVESN